MKVGIGTATDHFKYSRLHTNMEEKRMIIGFVIWSIVALLFFGIGIWSRKAEKPVGFWSNVKAPEVNDVKEYNNAVSIIWFVFAVIFELLGFPLLFFEQNSPIFLVVAVGTVFLIIGIMIAYTRVENKYRKK